jgi:phage baseplate assembly protein W
MNPDSPYAVDTRGRTATADDEHHVRDMIGQVLFTAPGERVNRPDFGCGLSQIVFEPNGAELAAATQLQAHGALQLQEVSVEAADSTLRVLVHYVVRRTQQRRLAEFRQPGVVP